MPKDDKKHKIEIKEKKSGLSEFTRRPVPDEKEVRVFEDYVNEEAREEDIEESLNEIYQDDNGGMVNVRKLDVRKTHGPFFWLVIFLLFLAIFGGGGYYVYRNFFLSSGFDATAVNLELTAKPEVLAGEEFSYTVYYQNESSVDINNLNLDFKYSDNFIFSSAQPSPTKRNNIWELGVLPAHSGAKVVVKGEFIGPKDDTGLAVAHLSYRPVGFSAEFSKEALFSTKIKDIGLDINIEHNSTALLNNDNVILIRIAPKDENFIKQFRIRVEPQENIELLGENDRQALVNEISHISPRPGVYDIEDMPKEERVLPVYFKILEKVADKQEITVYFEKQTDEEKYMQFLVEKAEFEIMKSDLNLTLIINGSRDNQGVDFGSTLNYSIVYNNKGDTEMKNVVIMAVLESEFLDWSTLNNPLHGQEVGQTITWTKNEIPELAHLAEDQEGTIDFSIKVADATAAVDTGKDYKITSYAQYSFGDKDETVDNQEATTENRSNTIVNIINSDLRLSEEIRYFSKDNIPLGTGPYPPKVGKTSTYKVFWHLTNNLHELSDLEVTVSLPDKIGWDGKERATVGNLYYNENNNEVVWHIGRLPITVFEANAEFSISVKPTTEDVGKIMVLLPGTNVQATDSVTHEPLAIVMRAKTSKLEDDEIGRSDGIVE